MIKVFVCVFLSVISFTKTIYSQEYPAGVRRLIVAYPEKVLGFDGEYLIMKNGEKLSYGDHIARNYDQQLNDPSIKDMFSQAYTKGVHIPTKDEDPGRIRNESLMKAMYGSTSVEVQNNLTTITWCPKLVGTRVKITKINNVHIQLQKVSEELDKHPELKQYLTGATTFNWRIISGNKRLSTHSFGTSIDLNVKYSNYWQWTCRCKDENVTLNYKNQIPQKIVDIFEKYGFIWGGKWYHYDTMHFEYRPELL